MRTAHSNTVYIGPPGVGDLHCEQLPDGSVLSVWALDDEDRRLLAAGGQIGLRMFMQPHPPVNLAVVDDPGVGEDDPAVRARLAQLGPL